MIQSAKNKVFWTQVCWIDWILHILIELDVLEHLATLPGHEGSCKGHEKAFLNDPKCQKEVFGHFIEFGWFDWSVIAYSDTGN